MNFYYMYTPLNYSSDIIIEYFQQPRRFIMHWILERLSSVHSKAVIQHGCHLLDSDCLKTMMNLILIGNWFSHLSQASFLGSLKMKDILWVNLCYFWRFLLNGKERTFCSFPIHWMRALQLLDTKQTYYYLTSSPAQIVKKKENPSALSLPSTFNQDLSFKEVQWLGSE